MNFTAYSDIFLTLQSIFLFNDFLGARVSLFKYTETIQLAENLVIDCTIKDKPFLAIFS